MRQRKPLSLLLLSLPFVAQAFTFGNDKNRNTMIYAPLAGVHQNQALFEPVLFMESTPSSLSAYVGDARNGGSGAAGNILIPLDFHREEQNKRSNGWAIGAASGYQRDALQANDIMVPGFYYFEGAFGRATTESWTIANTGLRGYMELGLRNQRPTKTPQQQQRLSLVGQTIPDDNYFIVLRIGASTDNQGTGIVSQKPGWLSWAVQSAFYVPLKNKQGYANLKISPYALCFGSRFYCGVNFQYMHIFKGTKKPNSEFIQHYASVAPFLRYQRSNTLSLSLEALSSFSASSKSRNTHSTWPAAKLNVAFGF